MEPDTVVHLSTNRARRRLTSLIEANTLTTTPDQSMWVERKTERRGPKIRWSGAEHEAEGRRAGTERVAGWIGRSQPAPT